MRIILALLALALMVTTAEARIRCTNSETGKYVSQKYAKKHPNTTQCADTAEAGRAAKSKKQD